MCSGGGGGNPVGETVEKVVEYVVEGDLGDDVQEGLEGIDHNITQVKEGVIDPVGEAALTTLTEGPVEAYQGSDIDTTLETAQAMGELMYDIVDTAISGEDKGSVKDIKQAGSDYQEAWEETGEDYQEALDNIGDAFSDTFETGMEVASDFGTNVARALGVNPEGKGGDITDADRTQGGDILREEDLLQLDLKKSALKAKKKRGKKGLRIDYATNIPGMGKSGLAA